MINKGATAPPFGELKMKIRIEYTVEVDAKKMKQLLLKAGIKETVREFITSYCVSVGVDQVDAFAQSIINEYEDDDLPSPEISLVEKNVSKLSSRQQFEDTLDEAGI